MKEEQDYLKDIAQMRSMMERTTKFLSLSGLSGVMAGIYALSGAYIAYRYLDFLPVDRSYNLATGDLLNLVFLAVAVLVLTIATAIFLSNRKASRRREKLWNPTTKRLLINLSVPLFTGGLLILIFISKGLIGFITPFTLLFYGLALYTASKFTYEEMRSLGLIQIALGLIGSFFIEYGLLFWALGFGVVHIIYGIYMHYRYER